MRQSFVYNKGFLPSSIYLEKKTVKLGEQGLQHKLYYFFQEKILTKEWFQHIQYRRNRLFLSNIGLVLDNQGKYEEALEHYNKSLEIDRKVFGTDKHATIATSLSNIGLVLDDQGKYEEALEHYNKSEKKI